MLKKIILVLTCMFFFGLVYAEASGKIINIFINDKQVVSQPGPVNVDNRVFVPLRFISEQLGAQVDWDAASNTVAITGNDGDSYLKGAYNSGASGIFNNLISAAGLRDILDDDNDKELADYRDGHSGGDDISNDPLVVDLRKQDDYNAGHVPGAIWIAVEQDMGDQNNIEKLKRELNKHVANGGKKEIILYCYTGNTSGLAVGMLGAMGLPVKNLMYGFDISWSGKKRADSAIAADIEDASGSVKKCGG